MELDVIKGTNKCFNAFQGLKSTFMHHEFKLNTRGYIYV
jgi:hypothetical protein